MPHAPECELANDEQELVQHAEYFPSGELWADETHGAYDQRRPGYLFTGKELDEATGLYYYGARYYDPRQGQWLSPDPALGDYVEGAPAGGLYAPRNLALYTYSWNNPVVLKDRQGRWVHVAVGAGIGALVGGGVEAYRQYRESGSVNSWGKVAAKAGVGAVGGAVGALAGPQAGLAAASGLGSASSVVTGVGERLVDSGGTSAGSLQEAVVDAAIGAVSAGIGGAIAQKLKGAGQAASTAADDTAALVQRAEEIHDVLHPIAKKQRTTAVLRTDAGDIVAGGKRDLSPAQRSALRKGEIAAKLPKQDAEVTAIEHAMQTGRTPKSLGVSRDICPDCQDFIRSTGGELTGSRTAVWPKK